MRFQIDSVQADGFWVPLTDDRVINMRDNIYTMIVGQNAVGKSRLLRKIVSNYIFAGKGVDHLHPKSRYYINAQEHHTNYQILFDDQSDLQLPNYKYTNSRNPYRTNDSYTGWEVLSDQNELLSSHYDPDDLYEEHFEYGRKEVMPSAGSTWTPSHVIAVSTGRHDRFPNSS